MNKRLLIRVGLPAACLLVFMPVGHVGLPIAVGFLRFTNPQYTAEPFDYYILSGFLLGSGLAIASYRYAHRLLVACSIAVFVAVLVMAYHAWASHVSLGLLFVTSLPFVAISIWSLVQKSSPTPSSA